MLEDLKQKEKLTRTDISELLMSIGGVGEKRDEKIAAVKELEKQNAQGVKLEDDLADYGEF